MRETIWGNVCSLRRCAPIRCSNETMAGETYAFSPTGPMCEPPPALDGPSAVVDDDGRVPIRDPVQLSVAALFGNPDRDDIGGANDAHGAGRAELGLEPGVARAYGFRRETLAVGPRGESPSGFGGIVERGDDISFDV